jgi:uncharacterized RDD family membrane protein YckC
VTDITACRSATIHPVATHLVFAGFWRRLFATLIDFVLLLTLLIPIYLIVLGLPLTMSSISSHWIFNLLWFLGLIAFWSTMGATPGKRLLNCKVVKFNSDNTVSDISVSLAALRALAYIVSAIPIYIGFIWIGIDKNKRGFHDLILKTAVIIDQENYEEFSMSSLMSKFPK